jgi:hypothetical protein
MVLYLRYIHTVKPGYKDPGYKDILTNKDTILSPEQVYMRNKDNPTPLNILLISRSLVRKYTKFCLKDVPDQAQHLPPCQYSS